MCWAASVSVAVVLLLMAAPTLSSVDSEVAPGVRPPRGKKVSFEELRTSMREEFESWQQEFPDRVRPPLRGARALLTPDFVERREMPLHGLHRAEGDAGLHRAQRCEPA